MPYKYIGHQKGYLGKSLWEILGNLKNFGVKRMVVRHILQKNPEPSYLQILKVQALPREVPRGYTLELKYGATPNIMPKSYVSIFEWN